MGFLIFAYRKLFLKRKISDLQFREMSLSMKKDKLVDQMGQKQDQMSLFNNVLQQAYTNPMTALQEKLAGGQALSSDKNQDNTQSPDIQSLIAQYMVPQMQMAQQMNQAKSIFETAQKSEMTKMHNEDTRIEQEMARLETQLKTMTAELESVEKAEGDAAKQAAPKFGQG